MCARYELNEQPRNIAVRFGLDALPPVVNRAIIRPTDQALVVRSGGDAVLCGWGFDVTWDSKPLINGRAETLDQKPTFRPYLENRCVVPATGYFEWRTGERAKHKNFIRPADQATYAMAGLAVNNRFIVLTCAPAPGIAHIHNRMPVILSPDCEPDWLDPGQPFSAVAHHLVAYDRAPMLAEEEQPPVADQGDLFH
ncbi:MAG: SOS response-associated peptidase [Rhodospirillales bacterium]|nr:SOS response-associated peptidase [Rhodospirillales bacterium]